MPPAGCAAARPLCHILAARHVLSSPYCLPCSHLSLPCLLLSLKDCPEVSAPLLSCTSSPNTATATQPTRWPLFPSTPSPDFITPVRTATHMAPSHMAPPLRPTCHCLLPYQAGLMMRRTAHHSKSSTGGCSFTANVYQVALSRPCLPAALSHRQPTIYLLNVALLSVARYCLLCCLLCCCNRCHVRESPNATVTDGENFKRAESGRQVGEARQDSRRNQTSKQASTQQCQQYPKEGRAWQAGTNPSLDVVLT